MKLKLILLIALLASSCLCLYPETQEGYTLRVTRVGFNSKLLGEVLGSILKVMILACLALMLIDIIMRVSGKKFANFGTGYLTRFIWYIYGTAAVYFCGWAVPLGYRGFNQDIYSQFQEEIYDAYFGSGHVRIFPNTIKVNGIRLHTDMLLENSLFIEIIIYGIFRLLEICTVRGLFRGSAFAHYVSSTRRVWSIFFGLYFWCYGLFWYHNIHVASGLGASGKTNGWVVISWILAIGISIEIAYFLGELLYETYKSGTVGPVVTDKVEVSYRHYINEVIFMFQVRSAAVKNFFALYYNFMFMFRWALFSFCAIIW
jgi:hypothetical protein